MKNIPIFLLPFLLCLAADAQTPFLTADSLNINNISATVLVHGDLWWNPDIPDLYGCFFPSGTSRNISSTGALWMSGYDETGSLHISAQTYRSIGVDYWPGPIGIGGTLDLTTSTAWAKIWKVNRTDIAAFLALTSHTTANTPASILTWPGTGNIYAQGNGGTALTVSGEMAPFADLNGDGIYEPLQGEYPDFPGDQALWWVFSDKGPTHSGTNGNPMGIEVHALSYGYRRGTLIDDVVYYEYKIFNRSSSNYSNFRIAQWDAAELGWYQDDEIGYDSLWRMAITYSGINCSSCGAGPPDTVWRKSPQAAVTLISLPGDNPPSYVMPGSFTHYFEDGSIVGIPTVDTEYNNYMRAMIRNGQHITDDFTHRGIQTVGFGAGPECNYVFPGDPSDTAQWSECVSNNNPADRHYVLSSNDFALAAGASAKIVMALIVADTAGGCPSTSFNEIKIVADTAWGNYYASLLAVKNVAQGSALKVYPNPATSQLFIENTSNIGVPSIKIYNMIGQLFDVPVSGAAQKYTADISALPAAVYVVEVGAGNGQQIAKFFKQ